MRSLLLSALLAAALSAPALAASYPVSGRFGVSTATQPGPIDCGGLRVISFEGNQRTDTNGGVPAYRNESVTADGPSRYRIADVFSNGQISNARTEYTLTVVDPDHIELQMQGGTLRLQRCR